MYAIPSWFLFALLPPLLYSATNLIDVVLVRRIVGSVSLGPLLFFTGVANGAMAVLSLAFLGGHLPELSAAAGRAFLAGIISVAYLVPYFQAVSKHEPDIVASFFTLIPGVLLVYAWIGQGEPVSVLGAIGVVCIVVGVLGASQRSWGAMPHLPLSLAGRMLLALACICAGIILFRSAIGVLSYWQGSFAFALGGCGAVAALFVLLPSSWREFGAVLRRASFRYVGANVLNETFDQAAWATARYAITLGPVAYVQAIGAAVQPFYMFLGWKALARTLHFEHDPSAARPLRRLAHFCLIALGVALVYITSSGALGDV